MSATKILRGKRILIVDDEPDIIESLNEILDMCKIDTATSFSDGKQRLENQSYDIAILDIMGVEGFELLKISKLQKTPALMLTAHALSEKNLLKSAKDGAVYFVPKDKMSDIDIFLIDIFQALYENKSTWEKLFDRLGGFYDKRFHGTNWRDQEKAFWKKIMKTRF